MNFGLWNSEELTLVQKARKEMKKFEERRVRYMKTWLEELIKIVEKQIFIEATFGESYLEFRLEEHMFGLTPLISPITGVERTYELTCADKDDLMTDIVKHYTDEKQYPELRCRPATGQTNTIIFNW